MKKLLLTMLSVALVAAPALRAQDGAGVRVNLQKLKDAITKSDADIADAKKAAKAATWTTRGDAFYNADTQPVNGLFTGMDEAMLRLTYGDAPSETATVNGNQYTVYNYPNFKAYVTGGKLDFFVPTTVVDAQALDKAGEAYSKAYELDAKTAKKVAEGLENVRVKSFENGGTYYAMSEFKAAAENFRRAYRISVHPALAAPDTLSVYYAGMTAAFASDFGAALEDLNKTLEMGYESEGEVYRLKFLALYNIERKAEALETLQKGLSLYPANEELIDMMMRYYAENDGDAASMIPIVEEAIAKNPNNPSLYQGLARVYDKLGQSDEAIAAMRKAVALTPDDFLSNYLEGLFIIKKGDAMDKELGNMTVTSRAQYQQALDAVNAVFATAIAPLEKAHTIDPSEAATVELLKNLTFRLRDDAAMNTLYEKYNALLNSMDTE